MELIVWVVGIVVLYYVILFAVKTALREVLYAFKNDIIKEFDLKKVDEDNNENKEP